MTRSSAYRARRHGKKRKISSVESGGNSKEKKTMNDTKNPFASKTIWGAIIVLLGLVGNLLGFDVPKDEVQGIITQLGAIWPELVQLAGLIWAVVGRFKADKKLSL